jgi:hypothetical protein
LQTYLLSLAQNFSARQMFEPQMPEDDVEKVYERLERATRFRKMAGSVADP